MKEVEESQEQMKLPKLVWRSRQIQKHREFTHYYQLLSALKLKNLNKTLKNVLANDVKTCITNTGQKVTSRSQIKIK